MLTKYCRICLTSAGVVHQLDEVVHHSLTLYAILCKMYPDAFTENNDPQWPPRVCGVCKQAVLDAYRLFTICKATFEVLKVQLPKITIKANPLRAKIDLPESSNSLSDSDEVDFVKAIIITDNEANHKHFRASDHENGLERKRRNVNQESDDYPVENAIAEGAVAIPEVLDVSMISERLEDGSDESENEDVFADIFSTDALCCKSCREVFVDQPTLENHRKYHREGLHIFCKKCNKGFKNKTVFYAHECAPTLCWICGKILDTLKKLQKHMVAHNMPEDSWSCRFCPLRFTTHTARQNHEYIHKKVRRHYCDICGANLSSKRNLNYHQRAVHGGGLEKLLPCNICGRRFAIPSVLKRHMNSHTGLRPYSCVYCNRVYGSCGDLVEHVAKHHVGNENIYLCHLCDADFPKIRELRDHYEVHSRKGEKFYNEILTDFGKFRFTTMDLLKMRHHKETVKSASIV
ncbi:zinc finger protein 501-like isoform X8 [Anopheles aquasalis]|uniref:zinc finger protein 501-like isoform X8 n=1 Tax=Anopheles aquasalis TaxID=42839 RepID=UPI00215A830E|nr:zinc finger protein 501-like isoform X8 [Anopheles aquasalis]